MRVSDLALAESQGSLATALEPERPDIGSDNTVCASVGVVISARYARMRSQVLVHLYRRH